MIILDITKKDRTKCSRMCDDYHLENGILYMWTFTEKHPHNGEIVRVTIRTEIYGVVDVEEVKTYG